MAMTTETPEKILHVARRLFIQRGYTATSMRQVAEEAAIGKATIYHYFRDKEAIVLALLHRSMTLMNDSLLAIRAEESPRARIQVAASVSVNFLIESADIIQVVRREVSTGRDQMQAGFMDFFREYMALLAEAIERGIEQGMFRPVDSADAARVLMNMIQGTFAMAYLSGVRPQSTEKTVDALLDVFFQGIDRR
jgi:AcrR family transcriptional regulator